MDTHALTWPKEGNARVPYRVFSDPDIYRAELDRLFLGPTPATTRPRFSARRRSLSPAARTAKSTRWSTAAPIAAT